MRQAARDALELAALPGAPRHGCVQRDALQVRGQGLRRGGQGQRRRAQRQRASPGPGVFGFLKQRIAIDKVPSGFDIEPALPLSPNGKIDKLAFKQKLEFRQA